ncbi:MAG: hypothetical protein GY918_07975 [Gammaproteobacteria bacterium]|nr:hypothetical protein [Gammaproteobacteria bacterium]
MSIKAKIAAELAERVKGGDSLAMDFASRMQRAKEQGFDTDTVYYHATDADIDSFDPNKTWRGYSYFTDNPDNAMKASVNGWDSIYPVFLKKENFQNNEKTVRRHFSDAETDRVRGLIDKNDQDGLFVRDEAGISAAVRNPKAIRSVNAAFDPAKKDSSNLLASAGAGIGALGLMGASDESEAGATQSSLIDSDARYGELGEIKNPDGTTSTEFSITEYIPELGGWVNIPTLVKGQVGVRGLLDGEKITREQMGIAIRRAIERTKNGAKLPSFGSIDEALNAASSRTDEEKYKPYMKAESRQPQAMNQKNLNLSQL